MSNRSSNTPLRLLFVCVGNSCRSQMAEGFARAMGGDRIEAVSAGTMAADQVAPKAVQVMAELGIDVSDQRPAQLTKEMLDEADRVFIMGCDAQRYCPATWLDDAEDWDLEDPMGQGVEKYREVRDIIRGQMDRMLRDEGIEPIPLD